MGPQMQNGMNFAAAFRPSAQILQEWQEDDHTNQDHIS